MSQGQLEHWSNMQQILIGFTTEASTGSDWRWYGEVIWGSDEMQKWKDVLFNVQWGVRMKAAFIWSHAMPWGLLSLCLWAVAAFVEFEPLTPFQMTASSSLICRTLIRLVVVGFVEVACGFGFLAFFAFAATTCSGRLFCASVSDAPVLDIAIYVVIWCCGWRNVEARRGCDCWLLLWWWWWRTRIKKGCSRMKISLGPQCTRIFRTFKWCATKHKARWFTWRVEQKPEKEHEPVQRMRNESVELERIGMGYLSQSSLRYFSNAYTPC